MVSGDLGVLPGYREFGFTASRHGLTDRQHDQLVLMLKARYGPSYTMHHGACVGGDDEADEVAARNGTSRHAYPSTIVRLRVPDFQLRSRGPITIEQPAPPLERNCRIVDAVHELIACPATRHEVMRSGTWATVRYARRRHVTVHLLLP